MSTTKTGEILLPPLIVRGMKILDKSQFDLIINVCWIKLNETQTLNANTFVNHLKKYILKGRPNIKPVVTTSVENLKEWTEEKILKKFDLFNDSGSLKCILMNPLEIGGFDDFPTTIKEFLQENEIFKLYKSKLLLTYDNWRADELINSILPYENDRVSSYSKIGHIIHLNLRDHLLEYKTIIGEILLDKIKDAKTIVNKTNEIGESNVYRNFKMEVLAGKEDFLVQVKENYCVFKLDFSKVYWNPRLSTEHERIIKMLNPMDVLYDIFAGVGPFAIPAGKRKVFVLANDLNPDSFLYLQSNIKTNKVIDYVKCFNLDGKDFIEKHLKSDLLSKWNDPQFEESQFHITMNLPALAVQFLPFLVGMYQEGQLNPRINSPLVHLYCFVKEEDAERRAALAKELVETYLKISIDPFLKEIQFVRNVSQNKDMYRVSFYLTQHLLFLDDDQEEKEGPNSKRLRLDMNTTINNNSKDGETRKQEEEQKSKSTKREKEYF